MYKKLAQTHFKLVKKCSELWVNLEAVADGGQTTQHVTKPSHHVKFNSNFIMEDKEGEKCTRDTSDGLSARSLSLNSDDQL